MAAINTIHNLLQLILYKTKYEPTRNGICELTCLTCKRLYSYVGQTGRTLKQKYKNTQEQQSKVRICTTHPIKSTPISNTMSLLRKVKKGISMNSYE